MEKIIYINLSNCKIEEENYDIKKISHYGRGLASYIIENNVEKSTDRLDEENCIVIAPGLFSGTLVPGTGRLTVASKRSKQEGIQFVNLSGPFSQKLASLGIKAVVFSGVNKDESPAAILFNEDGIFIEKQKELKETPVSQTIDLLRGKWGRECALIGIGPAGEHMLPAAALFSTYPEDGVPVYHCARGGMGDVFGSKGIKVIAVKSNKNFAAPVHDSEGMKKGAREIADVIVNHPICGAALPGYGSITLMKMLKNGKNIEIPDIKRNKEVTVAEQNVNNSIEDAALKINRTCSPLCVIGCLNRHVKSGTNFFSSPAESEVYAALEQAFGIKDYEFTSKYNKIAFDMGIDSIEFIFSCALYFKLQDIKAGKSDLENALEEVKKLSLVGRVIASKTGGIFSLYKDKKEFSSMVTKPSISEEKKFNVSISSKLENFDNLSHMDYLYAQIIALENFGICLFSAFALIESNEVLNILTNLYYCKTGIETKPENIIKYSLECLEREINYESQAKMQSVQKTIPEFVKVLYRYFNDNCLNNPTI